MKLSKTTIALDAAIQERYGVADSVTFTDGIPTMDDGLAFFVSQLSYMEAKIYEAKYTNINFADLVPVDSSVPEWADTWTYLSYDGVTIGKFIGAAADDLPSVAMSADKSTVNIGYAGISHQYTLDELRKSQQMRMPIDITQARIAFRGSQEHIQRVAYFGDAARKMNGLFSNPNVATDNSTVNWNTATGPEIFADVNSLLTKVWIDSANVHLPDTLVIDSKRWALITGRKFDTNSGDTRTIADYIRANNLYTVTTGRPLNIQPRLQLLAANLAAGGVSNSNKDRMMAYEKNEENLSMVVPIPFRSLAPQLDGLKIKVPSEYKMSGVEVRFPLSAAYRDFNTAVA